MNYATSRTVARMAIPDFSLSSSAAIKSRQERGRYDSFQVNWKWPITTIRTQALKNSRMVRCEFRRETICSSWVL